MLHDTWARLFPVVQLDDSLSRRSETPSYFEDGNELNLSNGKFMGEIRWLYNQWVCDGTSGRTLAHMSKRQW